MAQTPFFRPVFTERLLQRLMQGEVINLVGSDKHGASRILFDIQQRNEEAEENILLLLSDMEAFQEDYQAFLKGISTALGLQEAAFDMGEWIEAVKLSGVRLFLFLNHFDKVLDKFPPSFFEDLNAFLLAPKMSLLVITEKPVEMNIMRLDSFMQAGQFQPEVHKLPPIGYKRIKEELLRVQPQLDDWNDLASLIYSQEDVYGFMQFVRAKLESMEVGELLNLDQLGKSWLAEFNGEEYNPNGNGSNGLKGFLGKFFK
ncbi:MAG: hypothetical protein MRZ79_19415 [Bacteroidia bacterium]|nr:hypothetical protein [Bacteroidia bacterium]